ncbi:MAG: cytochrome c [Bacteriovoracaceae bacterium]|nr:cytochrome c [Bacteriovoracaceae bacterium]
MKTYQFSIFVLIFLVGCSKNPKEKGYEFMPEMVHSQAYEAYSDNPVTKNKKTMQLKAFGSIARGHLPFTYGSGDKEAQRAGEELVNPIAFNKDNVARGKYMYEIYCLSCHGVSGEGDGPLIPKFPNPPDFKTKRVLSYLDGRMYHIITRGSGDMPSHSAQIFPEDRWKLIHYVRVMQNLRK